MSFIASVPAPFPNILWWVFSLNMDKVIFDYAAYFEKMTYRNRYCIAGANGNITLSIPLVHGRSQRLPIREVQISNKEKWQVQHWRTLTSAYKRSPYFEFYEPGLQPLFEQEFQTLVDYNLATIHWLKQQLKTSFTEEFSTGFQKEYDGVTTDLRQMQKPSAENKSAKDFPKYYQLFEDRIGFQPNLSVLDLLFAEGPYAAQWLKNEQSAIMQWHLTATRE